MAMSKKDFITLADDVRTYNESKRFPEHRFQPEHIEVLCGFMRGQNCRFNESRWRAYLAGECGPSGGKLKRKKVLRCPKCKSKNVTPAFGHKLNKCDSCMLAFDTE